MLANSSSQQNQSLSLVNYSLRECFKYSENIKNLLPEFETIVKNQSAQAPKLSSQWVEISNFIHQYIKDGKKDLGFEFNQLINDFKINLTQVITALEQVNFSRDDLESILDFFIKVSNFISYAEIATGNMQPGKEKSSGWISQQTAQEFDKFETLFRHFNAEFLSKSTSASNSAVLMQRTLDFFRNFLSAENPSKEADVMFANLSNIIQTQLPLVILTATTDNPNTLKLNAVLELMQQFIQFTVMCKSFDIRALKESKEVKKNETMTKSLPNEIAKVSIQDKETAKPPVASKAERGNSLSQKAIFERIPPAELEASKDVEIKNIQKLKREEKKLINVTQDKKIKVENIAPVENIQNVQKENAAIRKSIRMQAGVKEKAQKENVLVEHRSNKTVMVKNIDKNTSLMFKSPIKMQAGVKETAKRENRLPEEKINKIKFNK